MEGAQNGKDRPEHTSGKGCGPNSFDETIADAFAWVLETVAKLSPSYTSLRKENWTIRGDQTFFGVMDSFGRGDRGTIAIRIIVSGEGANGLSTKPSRYFSSALTPNSSTK